MCLSRCTDGVRVNFVEFFTLPLCVLGTELRLPGSYRQPLYLWNHLTDVFKYLPETLHTGKVILSQEYSTIRLSRILHTFYFPTCIVCYSSPFHCSFFFIILYHCEYYTHIIRKYIFFFIIFYHCCCECHSYLLIINYNAMRTLIRFCVCPGIGRGSVYRCACSLISTNPSPSSKCQSYIRIANSGD